MSDHRKHLIPPLTGRFPKRVNAANRNPGNPVEAPCRPAWGPRAAPGLCARRVGAQSALALALLGSALLSAAAADLEAGSAPMPPALRAEIRTDSEPGSVEARRAFVTAGTNRFAFSVPEGFRLEPSAPDLVSLVSADYHSLLTFRIAAPGAPAGQEPGAALCRAAVLGQHPGAKILRQFTLTAANRTGPAVDAAWSAPGGLQRNQRVAFIPARTGTLEFRLVCTTDAFPKAQYDFNFVLLTFRAGDAQGKLDLPRFSNKF